jgi:class 3 adenylate cyclase
MSDSSASIESGRRLVTVMFADISGFPAMPEKMDPEWENRRW